MTNITLFKKIIIFSIVFSTAFSITSVNTKALDLGNTTSLAPDAAISDPFAGLTANPLQIGVIPDNTETTVRDKSGKITEIKKTKEQKSNLPDYSIKVNKKTNTVTVYLKKEDGELIPYKSIVCSVGRKGHDTPEGDGYKTSDYYEWRLMVDNTYGRYAVRFNGHIMFHSVPYFEAKKDSLEWEEYNKLGSEASLGCIRMAVADAKWIYDNCKKGTEVTVYSGDASTDPLGTPKPLKIKKTAKYKDWDPTDLTKENPWLIPIED